MAIEHITDTNFKEATMNGTVVVDFWAPWCGPCKMIAPTLEQLSEEFGSKVKIVKVNVDEEQINAKELGVMSIPTLVVFKEGQVVDNAVGFQPKEKLKEMIEKNL